MHCPAQTACLAQAMDEKIGYGIWGGLDATERDRLRRPRRVYARRPRPPGRPPEPSPIRGVSFNAHKRKWVVTIRHGGAMHWVGTFATRSEAEIAAITKCAALGTSTVRTRSGHKAA